jgi:exodeoxyribonuclease V alpha subunit
LAKNRAFKGIGVARASALWRQLGQDLYDVLEKGDINRLSPILGEITASELLNAWASKQEEGRVIGWLDQFNFNTNLAYRLIKIWGTESITKLTENPYRMLAFSIWPVVDRAALSLGVLPDDDRRLIAAVESVCYARLDAKHTLTEHRDLAAEVRRILRCNAELADRAIRLAADEHAIVEAPGGWQPLGPALMEQYVATRLQSLVSGKAQGQGHLFQAKLTSEALESIIGDVEATCRLSLTGEQRGAVKAASTHPLLVITGGAGVGKTTTLKAICEASVRLGRTAVQMALSGRAARRLSDATGHPAMTIAAFLNVARGGKFTGTDDASLLIIDEASMLDLPLMYRILRSVSPRCNLMLVGDPYQLPPIGFGLVFHTLAASNLVPRIELTQVHRQAASTGIPGAANSVRAGAPPRLAPFGGNRPGVSFINADTHNILNTIIDVLNELGEINEVQILAATKHGPSGVHKINSRLQDILSTGQQRLPGSEFAVGDPVIYLVNNYAKDLSNGSLGRVVMVDGGGLAVDFGHTIELLDRRMSSDLALAYAITVHKSQGSQFPRVIVPIVPSRLLDRTLIYTAITRAVQQVVLIGDYNTFCRAVSGLPYAHMRQTGFESALKPSNDASA